MTYVKHAFQSTAPAVWNLVPKTTIISNSVTVFKSVLTTFLFFQTSSSLFTNALPGPSAFRSYDLVLLYKCVYYYYYVKSRVGYGTLQARNSATWSMPMQTLLAVRWTCCMDRWSVAIAWKWWLPRSRGIQTRRRTSASIPGTLTWSIRASELPSVRLVYEHSPECHLLQSCGNHDSCE